MCKKIVILTSQSALNQSVYFFIPPLTTTKLRSFIHTSGFVSIQSCFLRFHNCRIHIFSLAGCLYPNICVFWYVTETQMLSAFEIFCVHLLRPLLTFLQRTCPPGRSSQFSGLGLYTCSHVHCVTVFHSSFSVSTAHNNVQVHFILSLGNPIQ